jgi:hypothetical protein
MSEVTRILSAIDHGEPQAAEQLLPLVYGELRRPAKLAAILAVGRRPDETAASRASCLVTEFDG